MGLVSGWCFWGVAFLGFAVYRRHRKNKYLEAKRLLEDKEKNLQFVRAANNFRPPSSREKYVIRPNEDPRPLERLEEEVKQQERFVRQNKDLENF